jgi:cytochrome c oxidase subunit II
LSSGAAHAFGRPRSLFAAIAFASVASACGGPQSTLDPAGPAAAAIAATWWWMFGGALLVWALVLGLLLRALLRGENTRALPRPQRLIVAGGLVLPTVVLAALLVYGSVHSQRITGSDGEVDLVVAVDARQWQWTFRYLDDVGIAQATTVDALVLPRGRMVEFEVRSADVIHSFWIPRLGGKIDAIPGRVNRLRLRADRAGAIRGQCVEFCGLEHARMGFDVHVLEPEAWEAWLRALPADGAVDRGGGSP